MANTLRFKRGLLSGIPTAALGEPLFTTDTFDLYIGNGTTNTRFQKYIASGTTSQILRGDGSLYTFPLAISSPTTGQVLKYNGTSWVNDSDAGITGSGAAGQVAFFTGATTQSGSNNLFWDSANSRLGIGTNTPQVPLDVVANTGASAISIRGRVSDNRSNLRFFSNDYVTQYATIDSLSSVFRINVIEAIPLTFFTSNTERARITSTGNFIINNSTTDNGLRFQVTGDGYFSGGVGIGRSPDLVTNYGVLSIGGTTGTFYRAYTGSTETFRITTTSTTSFIQSFSGNLRFDAGAVTNAMTLFSTGNLVVGSASDNGLRSQVTGDGYFSGNLGLGMIPSAWSGYKVVQISPQSVFAGAGNYSFIGTNWYNDGAGNKYITTGNAMLYEQSLGRHIWFNAISGTAGNAITFNTRMTLDASGNLGLGVTSPTVILDVAGTSNLTSRARFAKTGTTKVLQFGADRDTSLLPYIGSESNHGFSIITNNTEVARFDASGNLGLGVTPSAWGSSTALQIGTRASIASVVSDLNLSNNAYYNGSNWVYNTSTAASNYYQSAGQHVWRQAGSGTAGANITFTQAMTLDASGRLLLGTTTNSVTGGGATIYHPTLSEIILQNATTGTSAGNGFQIAMAYADVYLWNFENSAMTFATNNVERVKIFGDGNVGIGTGSTNAGYKLDVNGTMRVNGNLQVGSGSGGTGTPTQSVFQDTFGGRRSAIYVRNTADYATGRGSGYSIQNGNGVEKAWFQIQANDATQTGYALSIGNSGGSLIIASTGAATFSSSVTAGGILTVNSRAIINAGTTSEYALNVNSNSSFAFGSTNGRRLAYFAYNTGDAPGIQLGYDATDNTGIIAGSTSALGAGIDFYTYNGSTWGSRLRIASTGAATFSSSIQAATAIAIGTTPDTNKPFKILKNINGTVGINFENTSTGANAFSAIQMGTDVTGGTKFTNLVYSSSGVTASGVYNPDGTSLINNGSGGLNFLGTPIRFYTGGSNGVLRYLFDNEGAIQYTTTAPTTNAVDGYKQYSADVVAGNAAPHFRTENGSVIKLYQETTAVGNAIISLGGGSAVLDDTTFDGYTLRQIVKALRNQGILQ